MGIDLKPSNKKEKKMGNLCSQCLEEKRINLRLWQLLSVVAATATFLLIFILMNKGKSFQERWDLLPVVAVISMAAVAFEFAVAHAFGLVSKDDLTAKASVISILMALGIIAILSGATATIGMGTFRTPIIVLAGLALMFFVSTGELAFSKSLSARLGLSEKRTFRCLLNQTGAIIFAICIIVLLV